MVEPKALAKAIRDSRTRKALSEEFAAFFLQIAFTRVNSQAYKGFSDVQREEIMSRATSYFLKHWQGVDPAKKPFHYLNRMIDNARSDYVRADIRARSVFPSRKESLSEALPEAGVIMSHHLDDLKIKERYGNKRKASFMTFAELSSVQKLKSKIEDESYLAVSAMLQECHLHRYLLKEILKSETLSDSIRTKIEKAIR